MLEEVISLSQGLGTNSTDQRFSTMNKDYWFVLRSLHSRTCLHARAVLSLLRDGLVDPAWGQWRICHELATIATFIATKPDMAPRYKSYSLVNKFHLAEELYEQRDVEAPSESELDGLKELADAVQQDLQMAYSHGPSSRDYAWSGLRGFKDIEASVYQEAVWNPRGQYIYASERLHGAPKAGDPFKPGLDSPVFVVGPKDSGLTGPADLTAISIGNVTDALMLNSARTREDEEKLVPLAVKIRLLGAICWILDPEIFCPTCGGYTPGASPPDLIPEEHRPEPCSCNGT